MAAKQFVLSFAVTGGTPGSVTASGANSPDNGTYTISYTVDNNGPHLSVSTPDGSLEQHGNFGLDTGYAGE